MSVFIFDEFLIFDLENHSVWKPIKKVSKILTKSFKGAKCRGSESFPMNFQNETFLWFFKHYWVKYVVAIQDDDDLELLWFPEKNQGRPGNLNAGKRPIFASSFFFSVVYLLKKVLQIADFHGSYHSPRHFAVATWKFFQKVLLRHCVALERQFWLGEKFWWIDHWKDLLEGHRKEVKKKLHLQLKLRDAFSKARKSWTWCHGMGIYCILTGFICKSTFGDFWGKK